MNVSEAIRTKRAIRQFQQTPIKDEDIHVILNAGRRAQSSKNTQPWRFIAITDKSILLALSQCGQWANHLAGAALGIAIITPDPTEKFQTMFDAGQAAAYMQLAAWELGIGSCLASIYEDEKARNILGFPLEWFIRIALSFGYPLNENELTTPPRKPGRKQFDEVVHWNSW